MNKTIKTISELKDILLDKKELRESIYFCNLNILIIHLSSLLYEENVILSVKIFQQDSKKYVSIKTKDDQIRTFYINNNLLMSLDNQLCIYQKEYDQKIKRILEDSRQKYIKDCINFIILTNEDYVKVLKFINSYDSKNK